MAGPMHAPAPTDHRLSRVTQTAIGGGLMLAWPLGATIALPLGPPFGFDYVIYVVGLWWVLLWDPIAAAQGALPPAWSSPFTVALVVAFVALWLVVAALPLLGRWPGRQVIGLWALQFAYAGAQAIAGYYYASDFV